MQGPKFWTNTTKQKQRDVLQELCKLRLDAMLS